MLAHRVMMGVASGDPYFANVVALLHFDGADGSTTFTDVKGHTFTAAGNAQIDTAQSLFGGASLLCDGAGDYVSSPDSADWDFGTGDFTIEVAVRFAVVPSGDAQVSLLSTYLSSTGWAIQYRASGTPNLAFSNGDSFLLQPAWTPAANTWYRIEISRAGTSLRAFVNGTQLGSAATSSDNIANTGALWVGALNSGGPIRVLNGWIDELRITKGVARHTSNYTVDAAAFPDS